MSVKRIAWGVVVGVVVMVIAYVAGTWSYCCQTAEYVRAGIDERLNPKHWRLGDVNVWREEAGKRRVEMYRASMGDIEMSFITTEGKDGEVFRTGNVLLKDETHMGVLPSEETLRENLPEPLAEAATMAQQVAQEMRKHKPWPWSLRSIGGRVRDIAERRMRVEAYAEPSRGLFCSETLYGSERIFGIDTFGDHVRMTMWEDRIVARVKNSVLDFSDSGNVAYVDETGDVASLQRRVIAAIDYALESLRITPGKPEGVIEMLEESRMRFESQDYELKPELDDDARFQLVRPWYARIVHTSSKSASGDKPEGAIVRSAMVAGVGISKGNQSSLELTKDDVSVTWKFMGGRSKLTVEKGGYETLTLIVTEDAEYPSVTARFEGEEQEVLDEVRAMARDMLAVPFEDWPAIVWREELLSILEGVDEGRFYATRRPKAHWITTRLMAEGDDITCSISQNIILRQTSVGCLDVLLHANSFEAYDQRSGSLLMVDGDAMRLTQRQTDAAAGKAFDAATFAALAGMLRDYEDEVPEELRRSLDVLAAFAADPQIPQASPVDTLEAPNWSTEHRQEVIEALHLTAKVTIGN